MAFAKIFQDPDSRRTAFDLAMTLAVFFVLPTPQSDSTALDAVLMSLVWVGSMALAISLVYFRKWTNTFWFCVFLMCFIVWAKQKSLENSLPLVFLLVTLLWYRRAKPKSDSLSDGRSRGSGKSIAWVGLFWFFSANMMGQTQVAKYQFNLSEPRLKDIVSCGQSLDQISWEARPDGRFSRLLLKDDLALNSDKTPSRWEIHQNQDRDGTISFIFRRRLDNGFFESHIIKEVEFSRVVETKGGRKVLQKGDLKPFLSRPYYIFRHSSGSTVSFQPGYGSFGSLTFRQQALEGGRLLDPIILQGARCFRPDDAFFESPEISQTKEESKDLKNLSKDIKYETPK